MTDSTETEKPKPPSATFRVLVFIVVEEDGKPKGHAQSYDKEHENPLTALVDLSEAMEVSFPTPTNYSMARIQQSHGNVLAAFRAYGGKWLPILYPYDDGLRALDPPASTADPMPADPAPAVDPTADPAAKS